MKRARLVLVLVSSMVPVLGSCRQPPGPQSPFDGGVEKPIATTRPPGRDGGGRFYARDDGGHVYELALRKLAVRVTTKPGTVRSHLTMEIVAPKSVRAEAIVRLAVPSGAAVTSAVLWVNGRPMNGAFVERERARQIYRSIVDRKRDPALVTWDSPGWVSVSIFPLEDGEPRRFEIEWVEPAAIDRGFLLYRVPTLGDRGRLVGRASLEVNGRAMPHGGRDVVPLLPAEQRAETVVAARAPGDPFHRMLVRAAAVEGATKVVVVAETSAMMTTADRARQRRTLDAILDGLPAAARVSLLAADWEVTTLLDDGDRDEAKRTMPKLDAVVSAGALHLERALRDGASRARKAGAGALLFVGRGVDSFAGDGIRQPLGELRAAGIRLSAVTTAEVWGPLADAAALTAGQALPAVELEPALPSLIAALGTRPARPAIAGRGNDDWRALETITGQTVWVGRALDPPPDAGEDATVAAADPSDLLPLWERARLAWNDRAGRAPATERTPAAALTPLRALLVLETEADYARFGLRLPDPIATASQAGEDTPPENLVNDAQDVLGGLVGARSAQAFGVGGLGTMGTGSGGGAMGQGTIGLGNLGTIGRGADRGNGSGYGRGVGGVGARRARAPDVVPGDAVVRGSLDKEIIRRIIRRHINEVKYCYQLRLNQRPGLAGRVQVQFSIGASGSVLSSVLHSSTLNDAGTESCIVSAVRRWEFPRPLGGGIVIVSYPFTLVPGARSSEVLPMLPSDVDAEPDARQALGILSGRGDVATRVERIAALLGLDRTTDPETLAWMIDRANADTDVLALAARLLAAAGRPRQAVRVLTERAFAAPSLAASELRRLDAKADADEVLALSRRR
jgi:hypothetical protein